VPRRRLIVTTLVAGPALLLGWGLLPPRSRRGGADALPERAGRVALNGWLRIGVDDRVTLVMPQAEMGQGVHTALAMLVAEELRVPLNQVELEPAGFDSRYGNVSASVESQLYFSTQDSEPGHETRALRSSRWMLSKVARELGIIVTGGSSSVADLYPVLRLAAATARAQLLGAASLRWRLPVDELVMANGVIRHPSGPQARYGELAAAAALTPPGDVVLTPPEEWKLVGTAAPRLDTRAKVDGSARFGIDVRMPGLLHAAIAQGPVLGSGPGAVDVDAVLRRPGVLRVVRLPPLNGAGAALAVVASNSWAALKAARALEGDDGHWQAPGRPALDSAHIQRQLDLAAAQAARGETGFAFRDDGDADAALDGAEHRVEAHFTAPYLAHAAMEPLNCTAKVADGRVSLWVPSQVPSQARMAAARVAGVDDAAVSVELTYLGGGFGRRLEVDVIAQAVRVAMETGGAPVQLLWSREQDQQHDFYRPAAAATLRAALDRRGQLLALVVGSAGDAVMPRYIARSLPALAPPFDLPDKTTAEGLFSVPYQAPHVRVQHVATHHDVPVGSWRSVGHSHNAFFAECFMDEVAHAAGVDPVTWRLAHLKHLPRHAAVLLQVAKAAGWGQPLPAGRAHGVALHESFGTIVAQVHEVSLDKAGQPRVHRVVAVVDCGVVINPGIATQQIESAIVFGLSAALFGRIDIQNGVVQQSNFDRYPVLRLAAMPVIETHFIASVHEPGGLGEPGTPPAAPALANALFRITGQRIRSLPIL
jgi:isoquinoline 1-oxidoreductase subunit beta